MQKTPDETKKGLECCVNDMEPGDECEGCPYFEKPSRFHWICRDDKVWSDALALIQQLQADNAEKDQKIRQLETQNAELLTKVEQLQAERDAAVNDLKNVCELCSLCCACKDRFEGGESCRGCISSNHWQWRGVQKENEP